MSDWLNPWTPAQPTPEVETENRPRPSGLLDKDGRPLVYPRNPVGFQLPKPQDRPRG